jgi:ribosome-dependent ATPase
MIHQPEILILDEPTSGVDPMARDDFWRTMIELARRDNVTIFISTHFMNEAGRCDRIALMHAGRVLVSDSPAAIVAERRASCLEDAFIGHLQQAMAHGRPDDGDSPEQTPSLATEQAGQSPDAGPGRGGLLSLRRFLSCARRELLELSRDPIRVALAVLGSILLMLVLGFGINMDVEDVTLAVLDRDQTNSSHDYAMSLANSRYFLGQPPLADYADMDRRMRAGETSVAVEIPEGFGRDVARGDEVQIGVWIDGAMPARAETMRSYLQGVHQQWLAARARSGSAVEAAAGPAVVETRFRYNPDVATLPAMVPAVIPLLLFMIPAALSALAVVREKELGSIVNLYVTPVRRLEFLLGKQAPYIGLGMFNFLLLTALAVWLFGVPHKGSFAALAGAALLYVTATTAFGLLVSTFVRSQVAALFGTLVLSMPPVVQFSGLVEPVSSLAGPAQFIGGIFPTSHFLNIARGTFSKGLGAADLAASFLPLAISVPVLIGLGAALLRKQER